MKSKQILQAVLQAKNYENINLQISTESAEEKLILHELCMNSYGYPRPAFSENQQISWKRKTLSASVTLETCVSW